MFAVFKRSQRRNINFCLDCYLKLKMGGKKREFIRLLQFGQSTNDYTQIPTDDVVETSGESRNEEKRNIPYPKQIFCIISMEACERFSFYGMNTILTIYLVSLF